jgi:opacity protein-like surface antigen
MTRRTWSWMAICAVACAAMVGTAHGQQLGFYVGGNYGQSEKDADKPPFDQFALDVYDFFGFTSFRSTSSLDTKDTAFGFVAGYRLLPNLAFEGGYMDLGSVAYRSTATGVFDSEPSDLTLNVDTETSGIALSALGVLPLSYRMEVYARVGILFSTTDFNIFVTDGVGSVRDSFSESSTDYIAGIGAGFGFAEVYTARLEYDRVFDAGAEDAGGEADVDVISLGFTVAF